MTVWTTSFLFLTKLNICCVWTTILRKLHPDSVHVLMSTSDIREGWASVTADTSELVSDIKSHTKITCIIHNFCSKLVMYFAYWFVCFYSNFSLGWDSKVNIPSNIWSNSDSLCCTECCQIRDAPAGCRPSDLIWGCTAAPLELVVRKRQCGWCCL